MPSRLTAVIMIILACLGASCLEWWLTANTPFLHSFLSNLLPATCGGLIVWMLWSTQPIAQRQLALAGSGLLGETLEMATDQDGFSLKDAAWHEAAHVIANWYDPNAPHVSLVKVIRNPSDGLITGYTLYSGYRFMTRSQMQGFLTGVVAGGVADEMRLGEPTTGAGCDLQLASGLAEEMVRRYGFGQGDLRLRTFPLSQEGKSYSRDTAGLIDREVRRLIAEARKRARRSIKSHLREMHDLANAIETIGIMDEIMIAQVIGPKAK